MVVLAHKECTQLAYSCNISLVFLKNPGLQLSEAATKGVTYVRPEAWNFIKKETLAQVFSSGVFQWILWNTSEQVFYRTPTASQRQIQGWGEGKFFFWTISIICYYYYNYYDYTVLSMMSFKMVPHPVYSHHRPTISIVFYSLFRVIWTI